MYDYHTHSSFSDDCNIPVREMIEAAIKKGIKEMAVTDHYDPDYPDLEYPFLMNFEEYHKTLLDIKEEYKNKIKIVKGIEIGIQHGDTLEKCKKEANSFPYDFILGSFHCTDSKDLYLGYFTEDIDTAKAFERYYEYVFECLKNYMDFDVLGHINVVDRYVPFSNIPNYKPYMDIIEAILKLLIENGKGIEFNSSCYRYLRDGRTTPTPEILNLYKELGGEILTFGSDSHNPSCLGDHYEEVVASLKGIGFRYLSTYENRKVNFVKL